MANFPGHIIGRAVITVYNENAFAADDQNEIPTEIPTTSENVDIRMGSLSSKVEPKLPLSISQSQSNKGKEPTKVILQVQPNS